MLIAQLSILTSFTMQSISLLCFSDFNVFGVKFEEVQVIIPPGIENDDRSLWSHGQWTIYDK